MLMSYMITVKLRIEAPGLYQYISKSLIFAANALAYMALLYKVNVAWTNCFRKIFNAAYV